MIPRRPNTKKTKLIKKKKKSYRQITQGEGVIPLFMRVKEALPTTRSVSFITLLVL
jgi:hypothetical protein